MNSRHDLPRLPRPFKVETLQLHQLPRMPASRPSQSPVTLPWMRAHICKAVPEPAEGSCRLAWFAWNGDRSRGWTFYCGCGYCTPMSRGWDGGIEQLEKHWQSGGRG